MKVMVTLDVDDIDRIIINEVRGQPRGLAPHAEVKMFIASAYELYMEEPRNLHRIHSEQLMKTIKESLGMDTPTKTSKPSDPDDIG